MSDRPARYRFGPRSTRGLIAGFSGGQIVAVAIGAVAALGFMRSLGGLPGIVAAMGSLGGGAALALWPVGGRPAGSWLPTVSRYASSQLADGRASPWLPSRLRHSGPLSRLALREVAAGSFPAGIGVIEDEEAGTWSAVLAAGGEGYALLDDAGRALAVAAWSGVLASMAAEASALHRLQWIARTAPTCPSLERPSSSAGDSAGAYALLADELVSALTDRELLVVVTTAAPRRSLGGRSHLSAAYEAAEQLGETLLSLRERLRDAGIVVGTAMTKSELSSALRRSFEGAPGDSLGGWPWPLGVEESWSRLRTDGTWQASYWVAEWPRGEVGPGVLLPLIVGGAVRRSVSVTMAPLPPLRAVRRAEHERTSGAADAELRRRHGFALTARSRAEQEVAQQREEELAEGHAAYLFSGYVSVTAADEAALQRACREVEQQAALSQLELRLVYGAQAAAWCCTLPTGRGCK